MTELERTLSPAQQQAARDWAKQWMDGKKKSQ